MKNLIIFYNKDFDVSKEIIEYFNDRGDIQVFLAGVPEDEKGLFGGKNRKTAFTDIESHNFETADLIVFSDYKSLKIPGLNLSDNMINLHPSILPAFDCESALTEAFTAGVKVSGITIHNLLSNKIISQYPLLISNVMHFDEYFDNMLELSGYLFPRVIEKLLNREVFDFESILKNAGCGGGCSQNKNCNGCGGCSNKG